MIAVFVWLRDLTALRRENRRLRRELAVATSTNKAVQHLIRCTDPAMHIRLAHQLQQAETRLAEIEGADPHQASLTRLEVDG